MIENYIRIFHCSFSPSKFKYVQRNQQQAGTTGAQGAAGTPNYNAYYPNYAAATGTAPQGTDASAAYYAAYYPGYVAITYIYYFTRDL